MSARLACWIGVLGAEFLEAQLVRWSVQRSLHGALEEGLELTGAVLFLVGFVETLRRRDGVGVAAASGETPAAAARRTALTG